MVVRGFSSLTFLYESAQAIRRKSKPAYLYYLGDYDPSGVDITRAVEKGIREFAPDAEIHFERIAVTSEQIKAWNLPTRPTKKKNDRFDDDYSVEVDAIPPRVLQGLVSDCIERHIDEDALNRLLSVERAERESLHMILDAWRKGAVEE